MSDEAPDELWIATQRLARNLLYSLGQREQELHAIARELKRAQGLLRRVADLGPKWVNRPFHWSCNNEARHRNFHTKAWEWNPECGQCVIHEEADNE